MFSKTTRHLLTSSRFHTLQHGQWVPKSVAGAVAASLLVAPSSFAALPAGDASLAGLLGARPGETRLPVQVSDHVNRPIDVGTGNVLLTINAVTLPGRNRNRGLGASFNSFYTTTAPGIVAPRWTMTLGPLATCRR